MVDDDDDDDDDDVIISLPKEMCLCMGYVCILDTTCDKDVKTLA